jgi:indole-3-glycerol phosphate synthase
LRREGGRLEDEAAKAVRPRVSFAAALRTGNSVGVIAEIKRRSPSKGAIAPGLGAGAQAAAYGQGGAVAISVLTEPAQFGGSLHDLDSAQAGGVPLLRKDFIVDRLQLLEAVVHGASAVLLIAKALPPERLAELYADCLAIGLEALVETHDEHELAMAIAGRFSVVGVNNRDLESLAIDAETGARLIPQIPSGTIAVYESGVQERSDVERAARLGADVVLVGTALSRSTDPAAGVRGLCGVAREARRGD